MSETPIMENQFFHAVCGLWVYHRVSLITNQSKVSNAMYRTTLIRATSYYQTNEILINCTNRGTHYSRQYGMKAHYDADLVEGGPIIQVSNRRAI